MNTPKGTNNIPMRYPCDLFCFEAGINTDNNTRPFKHATVGRKNWRRTIRKQQRRAWKHVEHE